jgi:hypothetical protein
MRGDARRFRDKNLRSWLEWTPRKTLVDEGGM